MLKDKVHIHSVSIAQVGETKTFRLLLPHDLAKITGIILTENTVLPVIEGEPPRTSKADFLYGNISVGELILVERGYSNAFFAGKIIRNDNSIPYGEFAELDFYNRPLPVLPSDFHRHEWFKSGSVHEETFLDLVPGSAYLTGFYRDQFNAYFALNSNYTVNIYLFYEPEKPQEVCEPN